MSGHAGGAWMPPSLSFIGPGLAHHVASLDRESGRGEQVAGQNSAMRPLSPFPVKETEECGFKPGRLFQLRPEFVAVPDNVEFDLGLHCIARLRS